MAVSGGAPADASRRDRRRPGRRRGGGARPRRDQARAPARYHLPGVPRPGGAPLLPVRELTHRLPGDLVAGQHARADVVVDVAVEQPGGPCPPVPARPATPAAGWTGRAATKPVPAGTT